MRNGLFFFKQNTAYGLRISDWSSDVCSSDLKGQCTEAQAEFGKWIYNDHKAMDGLKARRAEEAALYGAESGRASCRERVCQRVDLGGRRIMKERRKHVESWIDARVTSNSKNEKDKNNLTQRI